MRRSSLPPSSQQKLPSTPSSNNNTNNNTSNDLKRSTPVPKSITKTAGPRKTQSDVTKLSSSTITTTKNPTGTNFDVDEDDVNGVKSRHRNNFTQVLQSDRESWIKLAINNNNDKINIDNSNELDSNQNHHQQALRLGAVVLYRDQLWRVRYLGPVKFSSSSTTTISPNNINGENTKQRSSSLTSSRVKYLGLELLQPRDENTIDRKSLFPEEEYSAFSSPSSSSASSSMSNMMMVSRRSQHQATPLPCPLLVGTSSCDGIEYFSCHQSAFVVMVPFHEVFPSSSSSNRENDLFFSESDDAIHITKASSSITSMIPTLNSIDSNNDTEHNTTIPQVRERSVSIGGGPSGFVEKKKRDVSGPESPLILAALTPTTTMTTTPPLSASAAARQSLQRLVDLMERRSTHDEELLKAVLNDVLKPPKNIEQLQKTFQLHNTNNDNLKNGEEENEKEDGTSSSSSLHQIERAISLAKTVGSDLDSKNFRLRLSTSSSSPTSSSSSQTSLRLQQWKDKILHLQSNIINNADAFRAKIAEVPDTLLEISRRLSFDAEDLIRTREEAAREHGDVEALQNGAKAAVRCLATACDILAGECDPESSKLFMYQREFLKSIVDDATATLNELRFDREKLAATCHDAVSTIAHARDKAHGSAEKTISDFALLQYKLKTKLTEEKRSYDASVHEEQEAMKHVLDALNKLERAGQKRVEAADKLRRACASLNDEKSVFAESLTSHRSEEQKQSQEEHVASALLQAVTVPCEAIYSDAERVTKEAEHDVKSLVRSSWMDLHQEHAKLHRHLMRNAGDLFFRHRASIQQQQQKQHQQQQKQNAEETGMMTNAYDLRLQLKSLEDEMSQIETDVREADQTFRRVSLEALQIAGIDWSDPRDEIQLQLEERAKTVVQGIAVLKSQKQEEEGRKKLLK